MILKNEICSCSPSFHLSFQLWLHLTLLSFAPKPRIPRELLASFSNTSKTSHFSKRNIVDSLRDRRFSPRDDVCTSECEAATESYPTNGSNPTTLTPPPRDNYSLDGGEEQEESVVAAGRSNLQQSVRGELGRLAALHVATQSAIRCAN